MTATIQSASMTDQEIHDWWASENGLEDCEMCKSADFHQVVRSVEARLAARRSPEALRPCGYMNFSGGNTICRKCGQRHSEPIFAALAARPATPAPEAQMPDNDKVICPACVHQFRAIPVNVQALLLAAGYEPPFLGAEHASAPEALSERQVFDQWFRNEYGLHPDTDTTFRNDAGEPWKGWRARAALAAPSTPAPALSEHEISEAFNKAYPAASWQINMETQVAIGRAILALAAPSTPAAAKWPNDQPMDSGMSWNGFNLYGDAKSIAEAKHLLHRSETLPAVIAELQERLAATQAAPSTPAATQVSEQAIYAIIFDDYDKRPEIIQGETVARARFRQISDSWNAHLFGKLESNSRDDSYANNNIAAPSTPAPVQHQSAVGPYGYQCQKCGTIWHEVNGIPQNGECIAAPSTPAASIAQPIAQIANPIAHAALAATQAQASQDAIDALRRALEIIAVGDSTDPVTDAGDELVALGYWSAEAVKTYRAQVQPDAKEPK